jgi:hypothetical protein
VPEYVDKLGIRYIIDFERMLASSVYRRRGGYDDPEFVARARPLRVFDNSAWGWRRLTLYRVRPAAAGRP